MEIDCLYEAQCHFKRNLVFAWHLYEGEVEIPLNKFTVMHWVRFAGVDGKLIEVLQATSNQFNYARLIFFPWNVVDILETMQQFDVGIERYHIERLVNLIIFN